MPDFETRLNELLIDIFNSVSKYEARSLKSLSDNAVTAAEAHIIEAVAKAGDGMTVGDIAAALNVAASTATVALKKLEGKGLVTKTASPEDGRRSIIRLTELGMKINRAHMYFHRRLAKNVGHDMTEPEKEILLSATGKLARFLREKADEDAAQAGPERKAQSNVKVEK